MSQRILGAAVASLAALIAAAAQAAVAPATGLSLAPPGDGRDARLATVDYPAPTSDWSAAMAASDDAAPQHSGEWRQWDGDLTRAFGAWSVGGGGYAMVQSEDDSGSGAVLGGYRTQTYGAGPLVRYTTAFRGTPVTTTVRWTREFGARRTLYGDLVSAAFSVAF